MGISTWKGETKQHNVNTIEGEWTSRLKMEINGKLRDTELIKRNGIQNVIRITGVHHDSSRACKTSAKKTRKRIKREDNSGIECKMQDAQWNNNQQFNKGTEQKQGEYAWDAVSLKKRRKEQKIKDLAKLMKKRWVQDIYPVVLLFQSWEDALYLSSVSSLHE